jgi:hypothetical protein
MKTEYIYRRNMVCYRYVIVSTLHKGDDMDNVNDDDDDDDDDDNSVLVSTGNKRSKNTCPRKASFLNYLPIYHSSHC